MRIVRLLACTILSLTSLLGISQGNQYLYEELAGVVSNEVIKGIVKDPKGYLWLATDQGVLNYDGIESRLFDANLQSNFTKNFLITQDDRLLVINDFGLREIIKQGDSVFFTTFKWYGQEFNQALGYPKSIFQDRSGNIWIGEVNSLVRINESGFKRFDLGTEYQSISYHRTFSFAEDAFGNLWIAPFKGSLLSYKNASQTIEVIPVELPVTDVTGLTVVQGDYLIIGGKEGLFQLKVDSNQKILDQELITAVDNISALLAFDGMVYTGTWDEGLFTFNFRERTIKKTEEVGFNDIVDIYHYERLSEIWVVGSENIGLFSRTAITTLSTVGQFRIESLALGERTIYYSIGQQIRKLDPDRAATTSHILDSKDRYFDCMELDQNNLWIGDSFGAIYRYDLLTNTLTRVIDSIGRAVKFVYRDHKGNLWFTGNDQGLIRIGPNEKLKYYRNITSSNVIRQSGSGEIYCGAYGNKNLLYKYDAVADSFQSVPVKLNFEPTMEISIEDLVFGEEGELWLGSNHGLLHLEKGQDELSRVEVPEMNPNEYYKALAYFDGVLWAASARGLLAFDGAQAISFTTSNGLPSKILKERGIKIFGDKLLVATAKGIAEVDTKELAFKKTPSPVFKNVTQSGNIPVNQYEKATIPYRGRIQAEFVTLSYPGKDIVYQSRIVGLDDHWSEPGNNRLVSFFGFSEGDYALEVRAREKGFLWSEPTSFSFHVNVPWFKTWWAYLLFSIATVLVFVLGIRIYNYSLIVQKRRLQRIIEERTEEINKQKNEIIEQKNRIIEQKEELIAKNNAVFKSQQALSEADLNYLHLKERQLQDQIDYRNKQITTHTLNIIQKNETLKDLRDKLEKIVKSPSKVPQNELRKTLKIIDESFKLDKDWEEFKLYFEQVYTGFYTKLKINCPSLTNQELRHCALIRLNLSLAECASILGISSDSVKVSRARIRKKLDLEQGQGLTDFILSV